MNIGDVKEQLKEKNKEIYLNKLSLDLTNNSEVLVLTLENHLNNIEVNTSKIILSIMESFQKEDTVKKYLNEFIDNYKEYLISLLNNKKQKLENKLKIDKKITDYKEILKEENSKLKELLDKYFNESIDVLINNLIALDNDEFANLRISEYLKNVFKDTLNSKVMDTIINRDIILLNTFKDSYLKYLELNKNTIEI